MSAGFRIPSVSLRLFASALSGVLIASAFPPFERAETAWMALVPLLLAARYSDPNASFKCGFVSGLIFWLINISWLLQLSQTGTTWPLAILGWIFLSGYSALYFGAFAMMVSRLWGRDKGTLDGSIGNELNSARISSRRSGPTALQAEDTNGLFGGRLASAAAVGCGNDQPESALRNIGLVVVIPLLWVGLEYLRSTLFTGFAWNALGVSQFKNLAIIQLAEWGGVYAISAVIMVMNVALAMTAARFIDAYRNHQPLRRLNFELMTGLVICALCWSYGFRLVKRVCGQPNSSAEIRVAAIQPNIAQLKKWDAASINDIYEVLLNQTECVLSVPGLQLIIWPETAVPGPVLTDPDTTDFVRRISQRGVPLLVGTIEIEDVQGKERVYNSSFLMGSDGTVVERYRKRHLVPFGEYLPFDKTFSLIEKLAPLGFSCTPGATSTVFRLEGSRATFASLICFEDSMPALAAESVRNGAGFLINQTNDGWFDGTAGALQHMSHCIFRCVENRIAAIRCTNTGITCFIDEAGRVDMLNNEAGETRFEGFKMGTVRAREPNAPLTFYTRYGDWAFALPCGVFSAMVFVLAVAPHMARFFRGRRIAGTVLERSAD
jgi:apolipoprotein N-acyltransferase